MAPPNDVKMLRYQSVGVAKLPPTLVLSQMRSDRLRKARSLFSKPGLRTLVISSQRSVPLSFPTRENRPYPRSDVAAGS
jgi:hypothetical protein